MPSVSFICGDSILEAFRRMAHLSIPELENLRVESKPSSILLDHSNGDRIQDRREEAKPRTSEKHRGGSIPDAGRKSQVSEERPKNSRIQRRDNAFITPAAWIQNNRIFRGKPFSLAKYPFLKFIYNFTYSNIEITIKKSAQVGGTEMAMGRVLWYADRYPGGHAIYTLPSIKDVREFSATRLKPAILESPYFKERIKRDHIDNAELKQFGKAFLHFRGTFTEHSTQQIPSDFNIHDDLDWSRPDVVGLYRSRLEASDLHWLWRISIPTLPSIGIDRAFKESNQCHWHVKCERCNHDFKACCSWPDGILFGDKSEDDAFICPKCKRLLTYQNRMEGKWVADERAIKHHYGFHITQLMSTLVSPSSFRDLGGYQWKRQFYNFKLGKEYGAKKGVPVGRDIVLSCENESLSWKETGDHFLIGVDHDEDDWIVVGDPSKIPGKLVINALLRIENDDEKFSETAKIINLYNIDLGVIDAGPAKKPVIALCNSFPSRMFGCFYSENQREITNWKKDQPIVTVNRSDTLEVVMNAFRFREIQLPPLNDECETLIEHAENVAKQTVVKEETGQVSNTYIRTGPDHFIHAFNYLLIAWAKWLEDHKEEAQNRVKASSLRKQKEVLHRLEGTPSAEEGQSEEDSDGEGKGKVKWVHLTSPEGDSGTGQSVKSPGGSTFKGGYETGGRDTPRSS